MSFGLDSSFAAPNNSEQEDSALKSLAMLVIIPTLFPFIVVGALSGLTELGVLSPTEQEQELNTLVVAETQIDAPVSKFYSQIDLQNPVVTVKKCQDLGNSPSPVVKSVPCKFQR